jgi:aminoacrylate hydrolase
MAAAMSYVVAGDGCRVAYDVAGSGSDLVLIPGLGGAASFWSAIVPLLTDRFRVVAVDHRGAGRSDRPEGSYFLRQIASDTLAVLDALGVGAAHVVGHSTGGVVAQCVAIDAPGRVASLVLSGSWDRPDARFRELFQARLEVLLRAGPAVYQRLTHALGFPAEWLEQEHAALEQAIERAPATLEPIAVAAARIQMLLRDDRADELGRIRCRTLVLGADDDAIVPLYHSHRLAALIPAARLQVLSGGHFFPRVRSAAFAAIIGSFARASM